MSQGPPTAEPFRVVFMGTPPFALPSFQSIFESEEVIAVVTQPDRPKGRGGTRTPPPIKIAAIQKGLPVYQPERLRKAPLFVEDLSRLAPDLIVVVAFGQILPDLILQIPQYGCINLHASLLPKYRGAAPVQWAVIHGEAETGVTTMQMDTGMDTGPILQQRSVMIDPDETADFLASRLAVIGAELLVETVARLKDGALKAVPQDPSRGTIAPLLKKADGMIRWEARAQAIYNRWRGLFPWPGSTTFYGRERWKITSLRIGSSEGSWGRPGEVIRLSEKGLEVAAGMGYILINGLQPEGRRKMTPREYAVGHRIEEGSLLLSF
ncbi:MAG: methionyl-tRNA formyltransferase [Nitrospiria bacterium]